MLLKASKYIRSLQSSLYLTDIQQFSCFPKNISVKKYKKFIKNEPNSDKLSKIGHHMVSREKTLGGGTKVHTSVWLASPKSQTNSVLGPYPLLSNKLVWKVLDKYWFKKKFFDKFFWEVPCKSGFRNLHESDARQVLDAQNRCLRLNQWETIPRDGPSLHST